jgi:iron complex transport system ATP-binding protein
MGALVKDLASSERIAVLVAMHDLEEAARIASRVLLMRDGRALFTGSPEQALTPARLREAFDADVDVGLHPQTGQPYFVARATSPAGSTDRAPRLR